MNTDIDISKIRKLDGGLLLVLQQLIVNGSVTRTAEALNLGQSTISHSLTRLRELFEDPLFIRRSHGLEPTQRALQLQPQIEALLDLTRDTLGIGQSFDPSTSKRLFTISAPEFVTVAVAAPLLSRVVTQAPNAGIKLLHLPETDVFEQLRRGDIDAAIGRFEQTPAEASVTLLYEDEYCVACSVNNPMAKGKFSDKKYQKARHIWADSPTETVTKDSEFDYSIYRGSVVSMWLTALTIAAQTDYIVTCPRKLAESQEKLLKLKIINFPYSNPIRVSLAHRKELQDKGVDWLLEQIRSVFD